MFASSEMRGLNFQREIRPNELTLPFCFPKKQLSLSTKLRGRNIAKYMNYHSYKSSRQKSFSKNLEWCCYVFWENNCNLLRLTHSLRWVIWLNKLADTQTRWPWLHLTSLCISLTIRNAVLINYSRSMFQACTREFQVEKFNNIF